MISLVHITLQVDRSRARILFHVSWKQTLSFHLYNFKTIALVCDGASSNLKASTGDHGAYGNTNPSECYSVYKSI